MNPRSFRHQEQGKRDPEMISAKKWYSAMKARVGTDTQGAVHSVARCDSDDHDEEQRTCEGKACVSVACEPEGRRWVR